MNFIACVVKSAGSKVSANDLMYSLIILDKSHGKSPRDSFITPTDCRLAWAFAVRAKHNSDLLVILGKSYPGWRENDSRGTWYLVLSKRKRWCRVTYHSGERELRASLCRALYRALYQALNLCDLCCHLFLQKGNWGSSFSGNTPRGRYHKWWLN